MTISPCRPTQRANHPQFYLALEFPFTSILAHACKHFGPITGLLYTSLGVVGIRIRFQSLPISPDWRFQPPLAPAQERLGSTVPWCRIGDDF
jgi:hypothetical protein